MITHALAFMKRWHGFSVLELWSSGEYTSQEQFILKAAKVSRDWKSFAQWMLAHKEWKYEEATVYWREVADKECDRTWLCGKAERNRWDSLARLWQWAASDEESIEYWEQAIVRYDAALLQQTSSSEKVIARTQHNKSVVESWIDEKIPDESEQWDSEENSDGEWEQQEQQEWDEGQDQQQEEQWQWDSQQQDIALSEYQKEQLEQYQEQLEQSEKNNQQYFSPVEQQQQQLSPFDQFFGGQLQKNLPNTEWVKDR